MTSIQYQLAGDNAEQIAHSIESGISDGALRPGQKLPSIRDAARELGVAPGTVAAAYRTLRDRGLVETHGRGGTRVCARPPLSLRSTAMPIGPGVVDLADGQPDAALLPPVPIWPQVNRTVAVEPYTPVLPELREAGRRRLADEGIPAANLTLASGALDAMAHVLAGELRPDDRVAVEDPGWSNALDLLNALALRPYPLAMDAQGPLPGSLESAARAGCRAVIVTNRAQNPTGARLTAKRADALRPTLTAHPQMLLIEDDHAAELSTAPLTSLAATTDQWVHIRSASKPYGPDFRVALVAGDEMTVARTEGRIGVVSGWVSTVLQRLVLKLWDDPAVSAIVANARRAYDERRSSLIGELAARGIEASGGSGLNVWIPVDDETATVTSLLRAGWAVAPGSRFRQASPAGVRVTVSRIPLTAIPELADGIVRAITGAAATRHTT